MSRWSEIKGEDAISVLTELVEPVSTILSDKAIGDEYRKGVTRAKFVADIIKKHEKEVVEMLSILDGTTRKKYLAKSNVMSIVKDAMYIINDEAMQDFFMSQGQTSSGSAMENTEEEEK